jgi:hypothetical protein
MDTPQRPDTREINATVIEVPRSDFFSKFNGAEKVAAYYELRQACVPTAYLDELLNKIIQEIEEDSDKEKIANIKVSVVFKGKRAYQGVEIDIFYNP